MVSLTRLQRSSEQPNGREGEREKERERELVKEEVLSFFSQNGSMVASTEYESLFSGQRYTKRMEGEFFIIGQTKIDLFNGQDGRFSYRIRPKQL